MGYVKFVFDILFILPYKNLRKLCKRSNIIKQDNEEAEKKVIKETLRFLDEHSSRIEIVRQNGQLQKVYFIKMPYCEFENNEYKDTFLMDVDRSTT